MERRGTLVRSALPAWLRSIAPQLQRALGRSGDDLAFQGRDGAGRKTEVPWVWFHSQRHSPNPRTGWYCVYLFQGSGDGFYLALGHGATTWENGEFVPRPDAALRGLVAWARNALAGELTPPNLLLRFLKVHREGAPELLGLRRTGHLGERFENRIAVSYMREEGEPPPEEYVPASLSMLRRRLRAGLSLWSQNREMLGAEQRSRLRQVRDPSTTLC
jgi:hypothetical protein